MCQRLQWTVSRNTDEYHLEGKYGLSTEAASAALKLSVLLEEREAVLKQRTEASKKFRSRSSRGKRTLRRSSGKKVRKSPELTTIAKSPEPESKSPKNDDDSDDTSSSSSSTSSSSSSSSLEEEIPIILQAPCHPPVRILIPHLTMNRSPHPVMTRQSMLCSKFVFP